MTGVQTCALPICSISLRLISIDREILAQVDSIFINTIPNHFRSYLHLKHEILPMLTYSLSAQYHHQEKNNSIRTASYWENSLQLKRKGLKVMLGCKTWFSIKQNLIVASDSDLGYESLGKSNIRLTLQTDFSFRDVSTAIQIHQDVKAPFNTTGRLSIRVSL